MKSPKWHQLPKSRAIAAYRNMLARCENKNGKNPSYEKVKLLMSLDEWLEWSIPQYEKFIKSNPDTSPSVSRFNDSGDYVIGNLEIISIEENRLRQKIPRTVSKHGTLSMKRYCNCDLCVQAKKDYNKQYKLRKK